MEDEIAQNEKVANNQNEDERVREQALDKIDEGNRRLAQLEKEREQLEKGVPLRERIKAIFKKYGFTVGALPLPWEKLLD